MVLYRKYRPQNFDELVGQDHITTTLKNALKHNRVAHAYLFAGPRGTGKTSTARVLAGELGVKELDLIEIDAASHRGIDDIRTLRSQVNFMPTQSPKKFYILDEAHMLTMDAFNALLKTLEEPPGHVHFVLCTTEPHKLPLTIVSRCQRFDFNLADKQTLTDYVADIAKKEKIKAAREVYELVAKLGMGSFRDALTFLESLTHHTQKESLTLEKAQKILGLVGAKEARELNKLILDKVVDKALKKIGDLEKRGVNFYYLLELMVKQLREDLVGAGVLANKGKPAQPEQSRAILALMRLLHQAAAEVKTAPLPQLPLEMVVVEWGLDSQSGASASNASNLKSQPSSQPPHPQPPTPNLGDFWPKVLELIKPHNHSVEALLKGCQPSSFSDNILTLRFFYRFHKERIEEARNRQLVEKVVSEVLGQKVQVRCELGEKQKPARAPLKSVHFRAQAEVNSVPAENPAQSSPDDLLKMAQEVFGGEIVE